MTMMRYATRQYAAALLSALKNKRGKARKEVLWNFFIMLRKNHDTARLDTILRQAERVALRGANLMKVEIESAVPLTPEVKRGISRMLGGRARFEESVLPELLGGIKILIDGETLIDASIKKRIELIFRK